MHQLRTLAGVLAQVQCRPIWVHIDPPVRPLRQNRHLEIFDQFLQGQVSKVGQAEQQGD